MSDIERYNLMFNTNGEYSDFVEYSDYLLAEQEITQLKAQLDEARSLHDLVTLLKVEPALSEYQQIMRRMEELEAQLAELRNTANHLARSAKIVSNSVNNNEYIPEFRYRQFEDGIIKVRELTAKHQ